MTKYFVFAGEYPFRNKLGDVFVIINDSKEEEAATALRIAINQYGGHPVVCPA